MKKEVYGQCHICGKYGKLSFEHIPPQAALNNGQVKAYSGEEILKTFHGEKATYQNMQRGMGRFSLCEKCNNTTGQWYAAIQRMHFRSFCASVIPRDNTGTP